jgi:hypothetical protein
VETAEQAGQAGQVVRTRPVRAVIRVSKALAAVRLMVRVIAQRRAREPKSKRRVSILGPCLLARAQWAASLRPSVKVRWELSLAT